MAVTLTVEQLAAAMRLGSTAEETAEATRLLAYSTEAVTKHAPDAPDVVHNEAVVRLAGYLYDQPTASPRTNYANALRNSGASSMLFPYRKQRAGRVDDEQGDEQGDEQEGTRLTGEDGGAILIDEAPG